MNRYTLLSSYSLEDNVCLELRKKYDTESNETTFVLDLLNIKTGDSQKLFESNYLSEVLKDYHIKLAKRKG